MKLIGLEVAAAEPAGQQMTLRERAVRLRLEVLKYALATLLTLVIIGLQIAAFVVSPFFFSVNLLIGCLPVWRHFGKKKGSEKDGSDP